jgi:hypothetical protein
MILLWFVLSAWDLICRFPRAADSTDYEWFSFLEDDKDFACKNA